MSTIENPQPSSSEEQEVRWNYSMSLPHQEGEPDMRFVIGEPKDHKEPFIYLVPFELPKEARIYHINVPFNIILDGRRIECVAVVSIQNRKPKFINIETLPKNLPQGAAEMIAKAFSRPFDLQNGLCTLDVAKRELEAQCMHYFETKIMDTTDSPIESIGSDVQGSVRNGVQ